MQLVRVNDYNVLLALSSKDFGQLSEMARLALGSPDLTDAGAEPRYHSIERWQVLFTALGTACLLYGETPMGARDRISTYLVQDGLHVGDGRAVTL